MPAPPAESADRQAVRAWWRTENSFGRAPGLRRGATRGRRGQPRAGYSGPWPCNRHPDRARFPADRGISPAHCSGCRGRALRHPDRHRRIRRSPIRESGFRNQEHSAESPWSRPPGGHRGYRGPHSRRLSWQAQRHDHKAAA